MYLQGQGTGWEEGHCQRLAAGPQSWGAMDMSTFFEGVDPGLL